MDNICHTDYLVMVLCKGCAYSVPMDKLSGKQWEELEMAINSLLGDGEAKAGESPVECSIVGNVSSISMHVMAESLPGLGVVIPTFLAHAAYHGVVFPIDVDRRFFPEAIFGQMSVQFVNLLGF